MERYTFHKALNYNRLLELNGKPGFTISEKGKERDTIFGVARGVPVDIGYSLSIWTLYLADLDQIIEQIFPIVTPNACLNIQSLPWVVGVKLTGTETNIDNEPGDQNLRIIKFVFNLVAEAYIPMPIVRKKSVLNVKTDFYTGVDSTDNDKLDDIVDRQETDVKDLEE